MKKALVLLVACFLQVLPAFAQQGFDFKSLDKLRAKAIESTNVTLEGDLLKVAASFLGNDEEIKPLVTNLKGIYVRSYTFAKQGQYDESDLAPFRAFLKSPRWTKIIEVQESDETSEVYLLPLPNNQLAGLAIISAEPKELTVVYIAGVLKMSDIEKLSGNFGIPDVPLDSGKKAKKNDKD